MEIGSRGRETAALALEQGSSILPSDLFDPDEAQRLAIELRQGELGNEDLSALARFLEILLITGQARKLLGPLEETALAGIWSKTPAGRREHRALDEVNRALTALSGRSIRDAQVRRPAPGRCLLQLDTDRGRLELSFSRKEVTLERVGVEG